MSEIIPPTGPIVNAGLPPYLPPYGPTPNITPFTYRDGQTYLQILEGLRVYINQTIVPFINASTDGLEDFFVDEVNRLIEAVNAAIQQIIDSSIEVQDPVVAQIFQNPASETRLVTDVLYAAKSVVDALVELTETGRLSDATLDAQFAAINATIEAEISAIEAVINDPGRLGQTALDARYVQVAPIQHAIFIGSSNSEAGWGWTQGLCNRRGWIHHNYAIGGASFVPLDGPNNFKDQIEAAVADTSYDHSLVSHIFITDMSNDIRTINNVESAAGTVFNIARSAFPKARIILIPVIWTYAPDNYSTIDKRMGVRMRYNEAKTAAVWTEVDVIPDTWLWFWDEDNWLQGVPPNFHLNSQGFQKLVLYIENYLDGGEYDNPLGWTIAPFVANEAMIATRIYVARTGNVVTINGQLTTYVETPIDTVLAKLPIGTAPISQMVVEITGTDRNRYAVYLTADPSEGAIINVNLLPGAMTYYLQATYMVM